MLSLCGKLCRRRGSTSSDPVDASHGIAVNGVTYFYHEDENQGESRVAGVPRDWSVPSTTTGLANDELPRPGTIEVAVAG